MSSINNRNMTFEVVWQVWAKNTFSNPQNSCTNLQRRLHLPALLSNCLRRSCLRGKKWVKFTAPETELEIWALNPIEFKTYSQVSKWDQGGPETEAQVKAEVSWTQLDSSFWCPCMLNKTVSHMRWWMVEFLVDTEKYLFLNRPFQHFWLWPLLTSGHCRHLQARPLMSDHSTAICMVGCSRDISHSLMTRTMAF